MSEEFIEQCKQHEEYIKERERLAKIEVLEELQSFYRCNDPEQWELASWVESTISDLKAGQ